MKVQKCDAKPRQLGSEDVPPEPSDGPNSSSYNHEYHLDDTRYGYGRVNRTELWLGKFHVQQNVRFHFRTIAALSGRLAKPCLFIYLTSVPRQMNAFAHLKAIDIWDASWKNREAALSAVRRNFMRSMRVRKKQLSRLWRKCLNPVLLSDLVIWAARLVFRGGGRTCEFWRGSVATFIPFSTCTLSGH